MFRRVSAAAVLIVTGLLTGGHGVHACSCIGLPACYRVGRTEAIFVGRVVGLESPAASQPVAPPAEFTSVVRPRTLVRLSVDESFVGGLAGDVAIVTGGGNGADCRDYPFGLGETYLIYAARDAATGQLSTGTCTGTAPLAQVPGEDLAYLRGLLHQPPGAGIVRGTAWLREGSSSPPALETDTPLPDVMVSVDTPAGRPPR